jgi:hypothetical protein
LLIADKVLCEAAVAKDMLCIQEGDFADSPFKPEVRFQLQANGAFCA